MSQLVTWRKSGESHTFLAGINDEAFYINTVSIKLVRNFCLISPQLLLDKGDQRDYNRLG